MKKLQDKQINISFSLFSFLRRFASIAIIIVLVVFYLKEKRKTEELVQLNKAAEQELQVSRNKEGQYVARIQTLQTARAEDFINYQTKDSAIVALQKEVKDMKKYLKKQGSVTQFGTNTQYENTVSTTEGNENLLVYRDTNYLRLPYKRYFEDKWHNLTYNINEDSTSYKINTRDEYSLTIGLEPKGFLGLGKPVPFSEVTNLNPYTETKTLRTYQVSLPPDKRWGIGPNISYGLGPNFSLQPTIGIGVQYNLLKF